MSLLLTMLPVYLFGNLHCLGMCGPLVMMISKHKFRHFYFLGRLLSFTIAGMIAGELGSVLNYVLKQYHIQALTCFIFGSIIIVFGLSGLFQWKLPKPQLLNRFFAKRLAKVNHYLSLLMLRDGAFPSFLFGFFTVALPCGQTLLVFSACALAGDLFVGMINGFFFALLTSPSLFFAMNAHFLLHKFKGHYDSLMGISAIFIGLLSFLRGFADLDLIDHFILNPETQSAFHIVIY